LEAFLKGVKERMTKLTNDFNAVKDLYYSGKTPPTTTLGSTTLTLRASNDNTESEISIQQDRDYIVKTSTLVSTGNTPLTGTGSASTAGTKPIQTDTASTVLNDSLALDDKIMADWDAYGFTSAEKTILLRGGRGVNLPPQFVTRPYGQINIGIIWSPTICVKARIFVGELVADSDRAKLTELFGAGKTNAEYLQLNRERKADLLHLADLVREYMAARGNVKSVVSDRA